MASTSKSRAVPKRMSHKGNNKGCVGNPHPITPPPPYLTYQHPAEGSKSLVEQYGLSGVVRDYRLKGKSYREITKIVNDSNLIPNGYKISHNAISRWCMSNNLGGDMVEDTEDHAINIYARNRKMLDSISRALDTVNVQFDDMDKQVGEGTVNIKDLKMVVDMVDKLSVRQQTLLSEIGIMQEKIYRYEMVQKYTEVVNTVLKARLDKDTYDAVVKAIKENPMLLETLRPIAPSNI